MCVVSGRRWKQCMFLGWIPPPPPTPQNLYLTVNDEFCRILHLNYPSEVVCGAPLHLGIYMSSSLKSAKKACLVPSKYLMSSFTCMWSSAAGREAHMHFTSLLAIFGLVQSQVYWTIHNLTAHWPGWDWISLSMLLWNDAKTNPILRMCHIWKSLY